MLIYLFRKYRKNWKNFIIGVLNITIGTVSISLILNWCFHELSYDKHYKDSERIYRVCSKVIFNGQDFSSGMTPPPLAPAVADEIPGIGSSTRIWNWSNIAVSRLKENEIIQTFNEKSLVEADSNFLDFFDCKVLQGDRENALNSPWKFVMTKKSALRYFNKEEYESGSIIGKRLTLSLFGFTRPCEITAIVEELPSNTHFHFDILFSAVTDPDSRSTIWTNNTFYTYVKLSDGVLPGDIELNFPDLIEKYLDPQLQAKYNTSYAELKNNNDDWRYYLQPIENIHLYSDFEREIEANGNMKTVIMLIGSCLFLFVIIGINLVNMNLFKSVENQKQFGVKRIIGSGKKAVWLEIFLENFLAAIFSGIISIVGIFIFAKYFYGFGNPFELNPRIIFFTIISIVLSISIIAGLPSILLVTKPNPERLVRNSLDVNYKRFNIRNLLITFQFFVSLVLISFSINVFKQNKYIQDFRPGFDKSNIIVINDPSMRLNEKSEAFISELKKYSSIRNVALCNDFPGRNFYLDPIFTSNKEESMNHILKNFQADYNFIPTFNLSLISGRNFSKELDEDVPNRIIINQKAIEELGFKNPGDAINKRVKMYDMRQNMGEYEIIGVLEDFNYESLHKPIHPLVLRLTNSGFYFCASVEPNQIGNSMETIKRTWNKLVPGYPFEHYLLEDHMKEIYKHEIIANKFIYLFCILSIILSCIGLYGLSQEFLEKKRKEIAIRKVNGARSDELLIWLLKYYNGLVLFSFIMSIPIGIFIIDKWLVNFSYKISFDYLNTIWIGIFAFGMSSFIVIMQSVKAFRSNLATTLKED